MVRRPVEKLVLKSLHWSLRSELPKWQILSGGARNVARTLKNRPKPCFTTKQLQLLIYHQNARLGWSARQFENAKLFPLEGQIVDIPRTIGYSDAYIIQLAGRVSQRGLWECWQ